MLLSCEAKQSKAAPKNKLYCYDSISMVALKCQSQQYKKKQTNRKTHLLGKRSGRSVISPVVGLSSGNSRFLPVLPLGFELQGLRTNKEKQRKSYKHTQNLSGRCMPWQILCMFRWLFTWFLFLSLTEAAAETQLDELQTAGKHVLLRIDILLGCQVTSVNSAYV